MRQVYHRRTRHDRQHARGPREVVAMTAAARRRDRRSTRTWSAAADGPLRRRTTRCRCAASRPPAPATRCSGWATTCWSGCPASRAARRRSRRSSAGCRTSRPTCRWPVPEILAVGEPGFGYPEKWSVVRYLPGSQPPVPAPDEAPRHALAHDLAASWLPGAASGPGRGGRGPARAVVPRRALATHGRRHAGYLRDARRLEHLDLDLDAVTRAWEATMPVPWRGSRQNAALVPR